MIKRPDPGFFKDLPKNTGRLEYIPNLDRVFGDMSRLAVNAVREHTKKTGAEGFVYGSSDTLSPLVGGTRNHISMEDIRPFEKFAAKADKPFFSMHTHPSGVMYPSNDDLITRHGTNAGLHNMMIEALGAPNNRLLVAPRPGLSGAAEASRPYVAGPIPLREQKHFQRFMDINKSLGLSERNPATAGALIAESMARRGVPIYFDEDARTQEEGDRLKDVMPGIMNDLKDGLLGTMGFARGGAASQEIELYRGLREPYDSRQARNEFQFWTPHKAAAESYMRDEPDGQLLKGRVKFNNPFVLDDDRTARALARKLGAHWDVSKYYSDLLDHPDAYKLLQSMGHDGVILDDGNGEMNHKTYVTMDPAQVDAKPVRRVRASGGRAQQTITLQRFHAAVRHARANGGAATLKDVDEYLGKLTRAGTGYRPPQGKPGTVKIPGYGEVEARPIPAIAAAARKLAKNYSTHLDSGFSPFNEQFASKVADAFDRMRDRPHDPRVKRAYDALIDETLQQYHAAKEAGYEFSFLKPGEKDPYAASPALGYADMVNKGRLRVFPTEQGYGSGENNSNNPLLKKVGKIGDLPNATANDAFRVVHDVFGHFGPGNPFFRAPGEERAFQLHSRMYGPEARKAAATETRGQNSWVNFGPFKDKNKGASGADTIYAPQKAGLLPDWMTEERPEFADGGSVMSAPLDHPVVQQAVQIARQAQDTAEQIVRSPPRMPKPRDPPISQVIQRGVPLRPRNTPTPEQIAAAKADTRTGGDIVNDRLDKIVPESTRVAGGTYTPGAPGGGRWADAVVAGKQDIPAEQLEDLRSLARAHGLHDLGFEDEFKPARLVDQPGHGFKTNDHELNGLWQQAVDESSAAAKNAVAKHGVHPTFGAQDWDEAMRLPLRDHLWYELSGEKMAENLPDLTAKEHMKMLDILGATSARAKPDENLERTLGALSQHLRGQPIDVDLTIPSTVRQALSREHEGTSALPGNKTGHFSDTLALAGGVPTRFPISVNDVWVGKMFGVPDDVMSSNQSLHEPMAIYFNKLRDLYNERHGAELPFKYQSWNFQAPAWVHLRNKESGAQQGDAYHQVWGKTLDKLRAVGVPGIDGEKITREALLHPGFADALRRTTKPYRDAPKATVEFGTTRTPVGKRAHELYQQALERGDQLSQQDYLGGLTSAMYQSSRGKDHPWDRLKKAVTGDVSNRSDITRIAAPTRDAPLDIGGTFEGAVSPNIRIPLKDMNDDHLRYFNAVAGKHLRQDAMAVSQVLGADHGTDPRPGYVRGHTLFVPTTEHIDPERLRDFARELSVHGHNMSFHRHPNGYQFDVLPSFGDAGPVGVSKELLDDVYGKTLHSHYGPAMVSAHDFRSVYTDASEYGKARSELLKGFRNDYLRSTTAAGISRRAAEAALKAEAPPGDFPRGGKEAWALQRARHDHLAAAEKGFQELAQRVADAHQKFIGKAEKRMARPQAPVDKDAPPFKSGGAVYEKVPKVVPVAGRYANGGAVDHDPSDAQKAAGNYAKERINFQGLPVSIENKAGSTRSGVDDKRKRWSSRVPCDYGYIRGTEGADGDHVDCYLGPDRNSLLTVVVNQLDLHGDFDEHKCMLGFRSERDAIDCYCDGFSDGKGPDRIGSVEVMSLDAFKRWLKDGRTTKPAKARSIVDRALKLVSAR